MNAELKTERLEPEWLAELKRQVQSLRYGTVQLVVHEARVVQIEKTEKVRFDKPERNTWLGSGEPAPKPEPFKTD